MRLEHWVHTVPLRLRSLFRSRQVEQELDDELRDHMERLIADRVANGLTPEQAHSAAVREMGGIDQTKENCRDARRVQLVESVMKDVRFGLRTLRRTPGFTAAAIVSLALGIGANTAIFSVVDAVLLKPLAYGTPDRLVVVGEGGSDTVAPATFLEWRAASDGSFERLGAAEYWTPNLAGADRTDKLFALHLSTEVIPLLRVEPMLGRVFRPDEEHSGHEHVVVISYNLWKNRFAADPGAIEKTISLDGEPYTIVGVMPPGFRFAPFWATKAELWAPLALDARKADTGASLRIFARLKPDVTVARARAEMTALAAALERDRDTVPQVSVTPLQERVVGDVRSALLILLAATVFVLLIACANVAHLQLVRAATRERELALRTALGASRARVVRQLLTESALLCGAGAAAGLLLGYVGVHVLVSLAPPNLPRVDSVVMDTRAFAFMLFVTVCAGVIFGLAPALKGSRVDVNDSLKEGGRASSGGDPRARVRSVFVVSEFAMAMVLLAGAGLILRSFVGLFAIDSGFDPRNVVAMAVSVTGTQEADPSRRPVFFQDLLSRVRRLPDVQQASAINHLPLAGDIWRFPFAIEGRPLPRPEDLPYATYRVVLPAYFQTMRIPILEGRDFTDRDVLASPHVVVINDFMARRHWPNRDPIGDRMAAGDVAHPDWCTIVGVVKTVKQVHWTDPDREEMYLPYLQASLYLESPRSFATYMTLVARTSSNPTALIASAQGVVRSLDRAAVVTDAISMESAIAGEFTAPRFYVLLMAIFAAVALVLAAVGIYGVISHSVTRRTHEIGVRMALGADRSDIFRLVVGHGMRLAAIGSGLGLLCALVLTRYLRTLLFGVEPSDPATFVWVSLLLAAVALLACYLPARRAVGVDPMTAVRCE